MKIQSLKTVSVVKTYCFGGCNHSERGDCRPTVEGSLLKRAASPVNECIDASTRAQFLFCFIFLPAIPRECKRSDILKRWSSLAHTELAHIFVVAVAVVVVVAVSSPCKTATACMPAA